MRRENRELGVNPGRTRHCKEESPIRMPLGNSGKVGRRR